MSVGLDYLPYPNKSVFELRHHQVKQLEGRVALLANAGGL